jgi:hypothetical protein
LRTLLLLALTLLLARLVHVAVLLTLALMLRSLALAGLISLALLLARLIHVALLLAALALLATLLALLRFVTFTVLFHWFPPCGFDWFLIRIQRRQPEMYHESRHSLILCLQRPSFAHDVKMNLF